MDNFQELLTNGDGCINSCISVLVEKLKIPKNGKMKIQ